MADSGEQHTLRYGISVQWECMQWSLEGGLAPLSAAFSSGLPSGGLLALIQSFWFCLWDLSAESRRPPLRQEPALCSRGELCRWVPGGASLAGLRKSWALGSLQRCRGLQCQSWECFSSQIIWKALFIVLVLFKNVHIIYVI